MFWSKTFFYQILILNLILNCILTFFIFLRPTLSVLLIQFTPILTSNDSFFYFCLRGKHKSYSTIFHIFLRDTLKVPPIFCFFFLLVSLKVTLNRILVFFYILLRGYAGCAPTYIRHQWSKIFSFDLSGLRATINNILIYLIFFLRVTRCVPPPKFATNAPKIFLLA